jgi:hypothetical protein
MGAGSSVLRLSDSGEKYWPGVRLAIVSRLKLALGVAVFASLAIIIAIAIWPRHSSDSGSMEVEPSRPVDSGADREKKPLVQPSETEAILKSFGDLDGATDRAQSNAPKMRTQQIKMH